MNENNEQEDINVGSETQPQEPAGNGQFPRASGQSSMGSIANGVTDFGKGLVQGVKGNVGNPNKKSLATGVGEKIKNKLMNGQNKPDKNIGKKGDPGDKKKNQNNKNGKNDENNKEKIKQYIIIDFKEYDLSSESKQELIAIAKSYCESKNISEDDELEITLLDNEEVENFLEKVFNNMKVIRGLISEKL